MTREQDALWGLPTLDEGRRRLVGHWLRLAVYALLAAGILSLLLALSRTPGVQGLMPGRDFFRTALVIHVDLSILVWFSACACLLWTLYGSEGPSRWRQLALWLAVAGTLLMSLTPFLGGNRPLMNNYIPVLDHWLFFTSLAMLSAGVALQALHFICCYRPRGPGRVPRFALYLGAWSLLLAVVAVLVAWARLPGHLQGEFYYDLLFWAGGHVLQFFYTLIMLVSLIILARGCGQFLPLGRGLGMTLVALVMAPLATVPLIYLYPVDSDAHLVAFTTLMKYGGLLTLPLGLWLVLGLYAGPVAQPRHRHYRAALLTSAALFAIGGITGYLITGSNTVIPAHYHGSIVGVTLALMGLIYLLLPMLGFPLKNPRMAYLQPYLYGAGQLLHVTALTFSGMLGVQRKVAGSAQGLDNLAEIASMAAMGLGGLLAVAGGVLFLYVVIHAMSGPPAPRPAANLAEGYRT